jgi:hypothetical protein
LNSTVRATTASHDAAAAPVTRTPFRLLHPGVTFLLLWTAVLSAWLITPASRFFRLTQSEKYVSASSIAFFLLAITAFALGTFVGPSMFRCEGSARVTPSKLSSDAVNALARATEVIFAIAVVASAYLIVAGAQRAGGFSALLNQIAGGTAWTSLAANYFKPAKITFITVWLHLIVAVAPLSSVTAAIARGATKRRHLWMLALGFVIALTLSFAFAERLIAFAYAVSAAVAWAAARRFLAPNQSAPLGRNLVRGLLIGLLLTGFWVLSEFSRTYLATRQSTTPVGVTDVAAETPLAADRFLAYVITSTNNGMYAVDHVEDYSYIRSSLSAVVTTLGWETDHAPVVGAGNADADRILDELYPYHDPLTTFSLPGFAFMDLGWSGVMLVFWFGAATGAVFARFVRGELWALLVYPLCVAGILDSYRIVYWTDTHMVVPVLGIVLAMRRVYPLVEGRSPRTARRAVESALTYRGGI